MVSKPAPTAAGPLSSSSSSTPSSIELQNFQTPARSIQEQQQTDREVWDSDQKRLRGPAAEDVRDEALPPLEAVEVKLRWNSSVSTVCKVLAAFYSFAMMGMNDGAYGPIIPRLETYYGLSYTVVSLVFLSPFVGYTLASLTNNTIHTHFGQRGIAVVAPICHIITYSVLSAHPPYPVLVVVFVFAGFGNGLLDAAWCAWIGNMANANAISGFLQAFYSLGATVSPLIATSLLGGKGWSWFEFYYLMVGFVTLEMVVCTLTFWKETGAVFLRDNPPDPDSTTGPLRAALSNKITWLFAIFVLGYVGAEVALGGWIVTFMINVRSASYYDSGISSTGFWAGMTVGRLVLGFVTDRFGERLCTTVFLTIAVGLELIFWLIPSFVVSAVAVAFLGFFMGPLFPNAIVVVTKLLPRHLHVGSIGFATAFGGSGGALFPFLVGLIAASKGVQVLQPIILALFVAISIVWLLLPRIKKRDDDIMVDSNGTAGGIQGGLQRLWKRLHV